MSAEPMSADCKIIKLHGGEESACGWCKDKWGVSWQITPLVLTKAVTDPDPRCSAGVASGLSRTA